MTAGSVRHAEPARSPQSGVRVVGTRNNSRNNFRALFSTDGFRSPTSSRSQAQKLSSPTWSRTRTRASGSGDGEPQVRKAFRGGSGAYPRARRRGMSDPLAARNAAGRKWFTRVLARRTSAVGTRARARPRFIRQPYRFVVAQLARHRERADPSERILPRVTAFGTDMTADD